MQLSDCTLAECPTPYTPAPSVPDGLLEWEQHAHLGDWIVFKLWLGCAGLVIAMNTVDLVRGVLGL